MKGQTRLDVRNNSFPHRTVNEWNKLSADCAHSSSIIENIIYNYIVLKIHVDSR